jgi:hypothetical protein
MLNVSVGWRAGLAPLRRRQPIVVGRASSGVVSFRALQPISAFQQS